MSCYGFKWNYISTVFILCTENQIISKVFRKLSTCKWLWRDFYSILLCSIRCTRGICSLKFIAFVKDLKADEEDLRQYFPFLSFSFPSEIFRDRWKLVSFDHNFSAGMCNRKKNRFWPPNRFIDSSRYQLLILQTNFRRKSCACLNKEFH